MTCIRTDSWRMAKTGATHTDNVLAIGQDASDRLLLRAAGEGAEHMARERDLGNGDPAPSDQDSRNAIELQLTVRDQRETYRRRDDGIFHVATTYSVSRMEWISDGAVESLEEEVDTELPD